MVEFLPENHLRLARYQSHLPDRTLTVQDKAPIRSQVLRPVTLGECLD